MHLRKSCAILKVGCALLLVAAAALSAADAAPTPGLETIRRFEPLPKGASLRAFNPFGSIRARFGGYDDRVELVATIQRLDEDLPELELRTETGETGLELTVVPRGGTLPYSGPERRDRIDLVVFVPLGAGLELETLDDVIVAKGVKSDVSATSRAGNIQMRSVGGRVRARSVRGKILAIFDTGATDRSQELVTETGEIEAHLWEDAHLHVEIATSGEISTDFSLSVEHLSASEPGKRAEAIVGGGGPRLSLRSKRGRIRLLRLAKEVD